MDKEKTEREFIKRLRKKPELFCLSGQQSVMEGFQYFKTEDYRSKPGAILSRPKMLFKSMPIGDILRLGKKLRKLLPSLLSNINKNFSDMEKLLGEVEVGRALPQTPAIHIENYPNEDLWHEIKSYVWDKYGLIVGFTEVPEEYIFAGKAVPFKYALVFAEEMDKEAIEKAPQVDAGIEVVTVYNSLGIITNDLANWLRERHGIVCMANHPLGGLVDTVPLAAKAGLGHIGRNGCLITKEFGSRCRLAPIFIDQKIFEYTDSDDHKWIGDFCKKCGKCMRACPKGSIYETPRLSIAFNKEGLPDRYEHYDREKCFTSFAATMGCGVCISVCPFSKNPAAYDRMKSSV